MHLLDNCEENLGMEDLAKRFGISYSYLRRLFREQTGASIKQFQLNIRLQRSCDLLTNTNKSVKVIAAILGFSNTFHFSKFFSQQRGVSPTEWRRRTRRDLSPELK
jgi:transcriptional regulator GlxA family with amidase domain